MYYQLCIKDKGGKVINIAITARHIITIVRHGSVPNRFWKFWYFLLSGLFGTPGVGINNFFPYLSFTFFVSMINREALELRLRAFQIPSWTILTKWSLSSPIYHFHSLLINWSLAFC